MLVNFVEKYPLLMQHSLIFKVILVLKLGGNTNSNLTEHDHTYKAITYRTRANKGRSRLVATPLTYQAKKRFL